MHLFQPSNHVVLVDVVIADAQSPWLAAPSDPHLFSSAFNFPLLAERPEVG